MIRNTVSALDLADLLRKEIGDKSLPIALRRGSGPSEWSCDLPLARSADDGLRGRFREIVSRLRTRFDLEPLSSSEELI